MFALIIVVLAFMVVGCIIAIEVKDLLSAVIAVTSAGFALSVVFLFLGAPDLALTQVVVEVICLIVLLQATVRRDDTTINKYRDVFSVVVGAAFIGLFVVLMAAFVIKHMPTFGQPLMQVSQDYLRQGLGQTGAANMVAAVLLDYRGYDTLGEATVIFTSIIGAYVVLRRRGKVNHAGDDPHS